MKLALVTTTFIICAFAAPLLSYAASSNTLAEPQRLCAANPDCKQELPDASGAVLFKIQRTGTIVSVRCEENGGCRRLYPRGPSPSVVNLTDLFTGK